MLSSQAQVREAQERLKLLRNGPRPETIRQARAKVESSAAAVKLAMNSLEDATLLSPLTGTILAKHAEPGELINPGTPIVTIGDLRNIWIRVFIPETSLGRIKLGQTAKVVSDTFPNKSYKGVVSFIASEAEFTPKNVQTEKERVKLVFRVKVSVDNPNQELKPGMPVDVTFSAE
jgi:HlyD family secretion protein